MNFVVGIFQHGTGLGPFDELATALDGALRDLEHTSSILRGTSFTTEPLLILLGANTASPDELGQLPRNAVIYNAESLHPYSPWLDKSRLPHYRKHPIWDYDQENVDVWRKHGISAEHVPLGYVNALERIHQEAQDIDVLFYGWGNPRRDTIVNKLRAHGVNVTHLKDSWGDARDDLIARSRIVLNIHFYGPAQRLETPRVLFLLMNRRFVVSEKVLASTPISDGLVFVDYGRLVDTCREYLDLPERRREIAEAGYAIVKASPMSLAVREAIKRSLP